MGFQIKKGGVYAAPVAVSVKKNGVYTAVVGVFAKVGGAYQSVLGVAPGTQPLMFVGVTNHVNNGFTNRAVTGHCSYTPLDIGSGDVASIVLSFANWCTPSNGFFYNANTVPIQAVALQYNGISVPVYFGGSRSLTLATNANDVQSDEILPAAFGVVSFPRGARLWVKMSVVLALSTDTVPTSLKLTSGGLQSWYYSPGATTLGSVDALGPFTYSGTLPSSRQNVMSPYALGRFVSGDPVVRLLHGDSISQAINDTGTNLYGDGWFQRAAAQADNSLPVATFNMSVSGHSMNAAYLSPDQWYWYRYANRGHVMYGGNDFGTSGTGATVATMQSRLGTILTNMNTAPSRLTKTIVGYVLPRTDSSDMWATEINQTYASAEWAAGARVDQYNQWLASIVGTSIAGVLPFPSIRASGDWFKWKTNGAANFVNTDAVHPCANGHAVMAVDARTVFTSVG